MVHHVQLPNMGEHAGHVLIVRLPVLDALRPVIGPLYHGARLQLVGPQLVHMLLRSLRWLVKIPELHQNLTVTAFHKRATLVLKLFDVLKSSAKFHSSFTNKQRMTRTQFYWILILMRDSI